MCTRSTGSSTTFGPIIVCQLASSPALLQKTEFVSQTTRSYGRCYVRSAGDFLQHPDCCPRHHRQRPRFGVLDLSSKQYHGTHSVKVVRYASSESTRVSYEVYGSTDTYSVFPVHDLSQNGTTPGFCSCPSFAYAVLMSESQLMVRSTCISYCSH